MLTEHVINGCYSSGLGPRGVGELLLGQLLVVEAVLPAENASWKLAVVNQEALEKKHTLLPVPWESAAPSAAGQK